MRKTKLQIWVLLLQPAGYVLIIWKAGWIVAGGVFLIEWARNLDRAG